MSSRSGARRRRTKTAEEATHPPMVMTMTQEDAARPEEGPEEAEERAAATAVTTIVEDPDRLIPGIIKGSTIDLSRKGWNKSRSTRRKDPSGVCAEDVTKLTNNKLAFLIDAQ